MMDFLGLFLLLSIIFPISLMISSDIPIKTDYAIFLFDNGDKNMIASVVWKDIESLMRHLDAEITEGEGSRVRFSLNGVRATFHRPHPKKETDKGALVSVRRF